MPLTVSDFFRSQRARDDVGAARAELSARLISRSATSAPRPYAAHAPAADVNVVGVGVAEKTVAGQPTGSIAVTLFVGHKFPREGVTFDDALPTSVAGIDTDVQEVGNVVPLIANPRVRQRPLQSGLSIGFAASGYAMAGTLGGIVEGEGVYYLLSNNHVLADEGRLVAGSPIFQPGPLDGGGQDDCRVAILSRAVALDPAGLNVADAAIARIDDGVLADVSQPTEFSPRGVGVARLGAQVNKWGRTSGLSVGTVIGVDTDLRVPYETGTYLFTHQFVVAGSGGAFSAAGDSGSLIVDHQTSAAVGLLFAGSATTSFANDIGKVLAALGTQLVIDI